jgi:hypothetical protein
VETEPDLDLADNMYMAFVPLSSGRILALEENAVSHQDAGAFLRETRDRKALILVNAGR